MNNRNLRISNLGVVKALECIVILFMGQLFHVARSAQIQVTVDALPSEPSDYFCGAFSVTTSDIPVPLSRWIIDNLLNNKIIFNQKIITI